MSAGTRSRPVGAISVRRAMPQDAGAIADAQVYAWRSAYESIMSRAYLANLTVADAARRWEDRLNAADENSGTLVGLIGGDVVGFACVGRSRDEVTAGYGELWAINLQPQMWGTGVGVALLEAATAALREMGFDQANLWVVEGNARARRFYEKNGWTTENLVKVDTEFDPPIREISYTRDL